MIYFKVFTLMLNVIIASVIVRLLAEGDCKDSRQAALCFAVLIPCVFSVICILYGFLNK